MDLDCIEEYQKKIFLDYIQSIDMEKSDSQTNSKCEEPWINKGKKIILNPSENQEKNIYNKENRKQIQLKENVEEPYIKQISIKNQTNLFKVEEKRESAIKKSLNNDAEIKEQIMLKNMEMFNIKYESQEEKVDLDRFENIKFQNIQSLKNNKEKKHQKNSNALLNIEKIKEINTTKFTTETGNKKNKDKKEYVPYKEMNKFHNSPFFHYLVKTFSFFILNIIIYINDIANSKYNLNKEYIINKEYTITESNYVKILEGCIIDIILEKYWNTNDKTLKIKENIDDLLEKEKNNTKAKIKLLYIILSTKAKVFFLNYLKNRCFIAYNNYELFLKNFKTLKDDLHIYDKEVNDRLIRFLSSSSPISSNIDFINEINNEENSNKLNFYVPRRKIMKKCLASIHFVIKKICNSYKVKLHTVNLKVQIQHGINNYKIFANTLLRDIYCNFKPRRYGAKSRYDYEEKAIEKVLKLESENNKNEEKDILYKLFNYTKYIDILKAFLYDQKTVIIKDKNGNTDEIYLKDFNTYKDCLNEYSEDEKKIFKRDLIEVMNGIKKERKKSKTRKETWEKNHLIKKAIGK